MLSPYRVLDLTDDRAWLTGAILADLGADVVRVEPAGGGDDRRAAPLLPGLPGPMSSARFHVYNRNKRAVTADLDTPEGRERLLSLVRGADFLVENIAPGAMAAFGLGQDELRAANPALVHVAVTPFGQDGPYAAHESSDLTIAAMGGMMALNGDADRAPLRVTVPQAWHHASAEAAVAALTGHFQRVQTGQGQFVDVSAQAAVFWTGLNAQIASAIQGRDVNRAGTLLQLGVLDIPVVFPAADGEVVLVPTGATMVSLVGQLAADGAVPDEWATGEDWPSYDVRFLTGQPLTISVDEVVEGIARWTLARTRNDLLEWGLANRVTIAPVTTVADVLAFRHLHQRHYWQPYVLPGGLESRIPGPFVRSVARPIAIERSAPEPGEHTAEIEGEPRQPVLFGAGAGGAMPFEGLKVADFSWIGVGPITAKYFADHGAEVVRVEGTTPPDRLRGAGPHLDNKQGINRSQFFASFNTSKKGILLNLKQPPAQGVAKKLLAWCDIALESFTPGTMADLGLGYEVARELNPAIIMASTCLMGQTGPAAPLAGYGYHAAAISGFYEVTGWPDRPPAGPFNAYTDTIAPRFLAAAVMAALDHRRRTGQGQYLEQAQMESALHFLAPELLAHQVTGAIPRRNGNRSPEAAPHNAYPALGEDQWVAIAVETDEQWRRLREAMANPPWAADPALDTLAGRLGYQDTIDARLSEWTATLDRYDVMTRLQEAGVPAGVVQRSSDHLHSDEQFAHRNFFRTLHHTEMGDIPYEGHQFRIAGYDNGPRFAAPCLGEHTFEVLTETLGYSADEAAELMASGAVGL